VNLMAGNLTAQVPQYCDGHDCGRERRLDQKITVDVKGEFLELKDTVNVMVTSSVRSLRK